MLRRYLVLFLFVLISFSSDLGAAPSRFTDNGDGTLTDKITNLIWQKCTAGVGSKDASTPPVSTCGAGNISGSDTNGAPSTFTWKEALAYCNGTGTVKPPALTGSFAGKTWRLPNIRELLSIVDRSVYNPSLDTSSFVIGTGSPDFFWSSTTSYNQLSAAWTVNFYYGYSYYNAQKVSAYYVRCVTQ
ncbi:DUF1566 domain-containing protein [Leptospira andrefontaineae]|uniref:DUF1566 domain-containing protein n=2 Tax=Leptospira andrefontaineae TaxID=2484976 RepID=A0A4R9HBH6_9LEPT|nr:DUF1566 domain-containing protein [Leptospira andrefontaineae]